MSIALVTGSTRGLGLATATALVEAGHTVIITGRDAEAVQTTCAVARSVGLVFEGVTLDVVDPESVASLAELIQNKYGVLDILVNNAGILPEATDPASHDFASVAMFRKTFETNVFGVVAVTEALLPLLRSSKAGRIVNVSSTMGSLADQGDPESPWFSMLVPAYQTSKAALNSITVELAKKLAATPVVVTSVCPGWVQTDLAPGNHENAPLTAVAAAEVVVSAALAPEGASSGTFIDAAGPVRW
ncbi:SDR family NAD(P)-dependent oxidoreductase [Occultella gossypii]|uniref:SDR family NAD(P)-dependent oxidoreductase n=1 Tax=Occultella gossypii TaxID=2800820 RepID=A0ABS7SAL1_9MICO|nr:SDR family NAD(P)-dependent oxidoreductase [Occultella gossypii]MBZ2196283.1 SDR family NAD(P)-dependent oxidoreductase [Occultella gossypii]